MNKMAAKIVKMRVNGIENPIGYDTSSLSFSWIVEGTDAKFQKSSRLIISTDPSCDFFKKDQLIHDSGESSEINSIDYDPQFDTSQILKPRTRYYWKVFVKTDLDEQIESAVSFFETSKLDEEWTARWISTEKVDNEKPPYVRKKFNISKKVKEARIYSTGMGLYELYVNGQKPTEEYFLPSNNNYNLWLQYQTFDVTFLLKQNDNTIGVLLGDGWARGRFGFKSSSANFTTKSRGYIIDFVTDRYEFLLELHILYEDGSTDVINTDKTWKCHESHVVMNNIYDGELQDANLFIKNWNLNDCNEDEWEECNEIKENDENKENDEINEDEEDEEENDENKKAIDYKLVPRFSLPVVVKERIKPVKILNTPNGETVIDMGQNMAGWIEMKIKAPKGFEVIVDHGEILQDNNFYKKNLGNALQQFRYISDGTEAIVHPHFTYYGFRYARLKQWQGDVNIDDFVGCVIYSDLEMTGKIETGHQLVNQLISNSIWSQKDNFLDVPTDCPQRAERLGWTGDAQIFCKTAMFNMNCYAFYRKFLKDLYQHQLRDDGIPPLWCPQLLTLDDVKEFFPVDGMIGWSDAATIMPWNIYVMNGKKQILQDQYDGMKKWVDVMKEHINDDGLWSINSIQFCDWLALDGPQNYLNNQGTYGGTELTFTCTTYYYYSLLLASKAAKVLGKIDDYNKYHNLALEALKNIREEYFSPRGRCAIQTQTALSLTIIHDLQPEGKIDVSLGSLNRLLSDRNYHLCTGFIGTQILCKALTKAGSFNDAMLVFLKEDYPGWLYPVKMGATTMWERWNALLPDGKVQPKGMNSFNHYAYGSICEWIYCDICGLNPVEEYPGFKKVILKPHPSNNLKFAKASYESPMGTFKSGWEIIKCKVHYSCSIPFNTEAKLVLLKLKKKDVISSNFEINEEENNVTAILTHGNYEIVYKYISDNYIMPDKFL